MGARDLTAEARETVAQTLERVERGERNGLAELRDALCGYVGRLRGDGLSRELTIDVIRTLVRAPRTPEGTYGLLPSAREALVELSAQWCAEEYDLSAGAAPAPDVPRGTQERDSSPRNERS